MGVGPWHLSGGSSAGLQGQVGLGLQTGARRSYEATRSCSADRSYLDAAAEFALAIFAL